MPDLRSQLRMHQNVLAENKVTACTQTKDTQHTPHSTHTHTHTHTHTYLSPVPDFFCELSRALSLFLRVPVPLRLHVCRCMQFLKCGLKLLVHAALSGLKLLVYKALSNLCMRPSATSVRGLTSLMYEALCLCVCSF